MPRYSGSPFALIALVSCIVACGEVGGAPPDAAIDAAVDAAVDAPIDAVPAFALTVASAGDGGGTITSRPAGISCGADCTEDYPQGTAVTLTAAAAVGSTFVGWAGAGCGGTGTCTVTITAATSVTAMFALNNAVVVTLAGTGAGTVTSSPAGITCGSDCAEAYPPGTMVTLTATPPTRPPSRIVQPVSARALSPFKVTMHGDIWCT